MPEHRTESLNKKRRGRVLQMTAAIMLLLLLPVYFGAYFAFAERTSFHTAVETPSHGIQDVGHELRIFKSSWEEAVFQPAVKIEALIRGTTIDAGTEDSVD